MSELEVPFRQKEEPREVLFDLPCLGSLILKPPVKVTSREPRREVLDVALDGPLGVVYLDRVPFEALVKPLKEHHILLHEHGSLLLHQDLAHNLI